jgi:hypothetical protein
MASRLDDLPKALTRGTSRRQALRGMFGGIVGALAVALLPSDRTEAVEASAQAGMPLRQAQPGPSPAASPTTNSAPALHQTTPPVINAGPPLNQTPPVLTETKPQPRVSKRKRPDPSQWRGQSLNQIRTSTSSQPGHRSLNLDEILPP